MESVTLLPAGTVQIGDNIENMVVRDVLMRLIEDYGIDAVMSAMEQVDHHSYLTASDA